MKFAHSERLSDLRGMKVVFVGDANNVANSIMLTAPLAGVDFVMACPEKESYYPDTEILHSAQKIAEAAGTLVTVIHDPFEAVRGADVIYTDIWASMGQEDEAEARRKYFAPYQVNKKLLAETGKKTLVSHCLPAHRSEEIVSEVLDGEESIAFYEAENRLHIQKAILLTLDARVARK